MKLQQASRIKTSRTGAVFPEDLSFADCVKELVGLCKAVQSSPWWIGGAINFLERKHLATDEDRLKHGVKYKGALRATGLEITTLRNYAAVDKRIETSRRRDELSWTHHADVAALAPRDQDKFLELAVKNRWSVSQLRKVLRSENKAVIEEPKLDLGFVTTKWVNEFRRGLQGEIKRLGPVKSWEPELRQAWKRDLKPII